jgi:hypothetical protein
MVETVEMGNSGDGGFTSEDEPGWDAMDLARWPWVYESAWDPSWGASDSIEGRGSGNSAGSSECITFEKIAMVSLVLGRDGNTPVGCACQTTNVSRHQSLLGGSAVFLSTAAMRVSLRQRYYDYWGPKSTVIPREDETRLERLLIPKKKMARRLDWQHEEIP